MRLYHSPNSPYARKARIIIRELSLKVEEVAVTLPADANFRSINPLGKIPALILDDGSCIYNSRVICEYLDDLGNGHFFPKATLLRAAEGRWRSLTLQSLGDGLADAVIRRRQDARLPESERGEALAHHTKAIESAFGVLERASVKFAKHPTIGELAVACALGYLDLRVPNDGWRERYPHLAHWLVEFSKYPSVIATAPPPAKV